VKAFDDPAAGRLREAWIEQNIASLESLLADVAAAIHQIDPKIVIGKMSCGPGTAYSGQAFERWYTALRATKARPDGREDVPPGRRRQRDHLRRSAGADRGRVPQADVAARPQRRLFLLP
jgi:hypothetical protein